MSSSIHINEIKDNLDKIKNLGHNKETFDIEGTKITLRTVTPKEREYAKERCDPHFQRAKEENDVVHIQKWMEKMKVEVLSYSIIRIGEIDLEGIDYIKTDEVDEESGKKIKKKKHIYLREFLEDWNDELINICFKKFRQITEEMEENLNNQVEFPEDDIDTRIEKKKQELEELRTKKKQMEQEKENDISENLSSDISKEDLKEEVFSPEKATSESEYVEKTFPAKESSKNMEEEFVEEDEDPYVEESSNHDQEQEVEYVDNEGNPLEGDELKKAREMDRLYEEKMGENREGREPLNKQNPNVRSGNLPEDSQDQAKRTRNAQKARNPVNKDELPIADGFQEIEPEVLGGESERPEQNENIEVNPKPSENPNYDPSDE
jgi:hypothetical protein